MLAINKMQLLEPGNSRHHLFTYHDIRAKLVEVYGEPVTDDDHQWLQKETRRLWKQSPTVMLDSDFHRQLHNAQQSGTVTALR